MIRRSDAVTEMDRTEVSRPLTWVLTALFALTISAVLVTEITVGRTPAPDLSTIRATSLLRHPFQFNRALLGEMHAWERALERESVVTRHIVPPYQLMLTSLLGVGNDQAFCGRRGWLHYRPEFEDLTGPGFLEEWVLAHRRLDLNDAGDPIQPDPVMALLDFKRQLRGIPLVVMPVPSKLAVHQETFASAGRASVFRPLRNPSYDRFCDRLRKAGILVFDVGTPIDKTEIDNPLYLETDTHWRPAAMQSVAEALASFLSSSVDLPPAAAAYVRVEATMESTGDLAALLSLPHWQRRYPRERVVIQRVFTPDGNPWTPDPDADVLLLGDSYTNVYSQKGLGWGESAGLAEQLSYYMRQPVDRIALNDGGAYTARQELAQEIARGRDRLRGKRVVIQQFAVRELSSGDWKMIELPEPPAAPPVPATAGVVTGEIATMSTVPDPGATPYRDCILSMRLRVVTAEAPLRMGDEVLVYAWGMQDGRLTETAGLRPGRRVELRIEPWADVAAKYDTYQRTELDDPDALLLTPYWGEVVRLP